VVDQKNKSTTNLWTVDVRSGDVRRLTTAQTSDSSPQWSPDGTRIAFVSKRGEDEVNALYVIPFGGGEAEKILDLAVANPKWMPDGKGIVVSTTVVPEIAQPSLDDTTIEPLKKELKRRKDSKMTAKVTENRQYRFFDRYLTDNLAHRLVLVDVAAKTFKDLTPGVDRLFNHSGDVFFDISPDGRTIALEFNTTTAPFRDYNNQDLYLLAADGSGEMKNVTPENKGGDGSPVWSPDGKSVYFTRQETPYYSGESSKLWRHDLTTGTNVPLTEQLDYSMADVEVSADGRTLWMTAEDKGVVPVFKMNADGSGFAAVHRDGTSTSLKVSGQTVVFLNDTTNRPNELLALDPATGRARRLTRFNDEFMAQIDLGKVESYQFKGANGADVHGWLVLPPGYDASKRYALVQLLHGGPHTMNRDSWTTAGTRRSSPPQAGSSRG